MGVRRTEPLDVWEVVTLLANGDLAEIWDERIQSRAYPISRIDGLRSAVGEWVCGTRRVTVTVHPHSTWMSLYGNGWDAPKKTVQITPASPLVPLLRIAMDWLRETA